MTVTPDKDTILNAVLDHVMFDGWSSKAISHAAKDLNIDPFFIDELFPKGPLDLICYFVERADDQMEEELARRNVQDMKIRERITLAVRIRLELYAPYKEAIRNALTLLALPQNAALALKLTNGTVSRMWHATGDRSADFSYYTKRLTLSAVYGSTLLYWLDDHSEDHHKTWEFLDRRIENVMQFETCKFKAKSFFAKKPQGPDFPSPARFFRNLGAR
ncbi:COQ9 family protein [Sneathiella limimaris]|uniref:COQ9 family protein n=1 Tax=Sneathiella limimaris TaxID=1964213 RepID=UPI00146C943C|nr:COQ9 family protein [Sneathiella limimaris]